MANYRDLDQLFGEGTERQLLMQKIAKLKERVLKNKSRLREIKADFEKPSRDTVTMTDAELAQLLSPGSALESRLLRHQTKELDGSTDLRTVTRVSEVLQIADKLLLSKDKVEQLIREMGFDLVAQVLSTLSGQQVTKSLRNPLGFPVTHVTIDEVRILAKQLQVTKSCEANPNSIESWLGLPVKSERQPVSKNRTASAAAPATWFGFKLKG